MVPNYSLTDDPFSCQQLWTKVEAPFLLSHFGHKTKWKITFWRAMRQIFVNALLFWSKGFILMNFLLNMYPPVNEHNCLENGTRIFQPAMYSYVSLPIPPRWKVSWLSESVSSAHSSGFSSRKTMPVCTSRRRSSLQDVQNRTNASWFFLTENAFTKYQWCWKKHIIWKLSIIFGYCIVFIHLEFPKTYTPIYLYPLYIQMPIASLFSFHVLATYIFIGGKTNVWWYPPFYAKQTKTYKHKDEPGNSAFLGWLSDPLKGCKCDLHRSGFLIGVAAAVSPGASPGLPPSPRQL